VVKACTAFAAPSTGPCSCTVHGMLVLPLARGGENFRLRAERELIQAAWNGKVRH
jgi:hypothetical protein